MQSKDPKMKMEKKEKLFTSPENNCSWKGHVSKFYALNTLTDICRLGSQRLPMFYLSQYTWEFQRSTKKMLILFIFLPIHQFLDREEKKYKLR